MINCYWDRSPAGPRSSIGVGFFVFGHADALHKRPCLCHRDAGGIALLGALNSVGLM